MHIIIKLLPWMLILYGLWGGYEKWDVKMAESDSLVQELSGLKSKLVKLQKAKKEIEAYYADIETEKNNIKKISKEFEFVQKKLPEKQNDKENLQLFADIAKRMLIKEMTFSQGNDKKKTGYIERSYTATAKGTYMQFLLFFESLYKYERLFDVKNILFKAASTGRKGALPSYRGTISTSIRTSTKLITWGKIKNENLDGFMHGFVVGRSFCRKRGGVPAPQEKKKQGIPGRGEFHREPSGFEGPFQEKTDEGLGEAKHIQDHSC